MIKAKNKMYSRVIWTTKPFIFDGFGKAMSPLMARVIEKEKGFVASRGYLYLHGKVISEEGKSR